VSVIVDYSIQPSPEEGVAVQPVVLTLLVDALGTPDEAMARIRDQVLEFLKSSPDVYGQIVIGRSSDILSIGSEPPPLGIPE
jgi:hypothetical protein